MPMNIPNKFQMVNNNRLYETCTIWVLVLTVNLAANEMKMKVFNCTLPSNRKRIKVIVSHPTPHIGQNDRANQPKGTDSDVCQELSAK